MFYRTLTRRNLDTNAGPALQHLGQRRQYQWASHHRDVALNKDRA